MISFKKLAWLQIDWDYENYRANTALDENQSSRCVTGSSKIFLGRSGRARPRVGAWLGLLVMCCTCHSPLG